MTTRDDHRNYSTDLDARLAALGVFLLHGDIDRWVTTLAGISVARRRALREELARPGHSAESVRMAAPLLALVEVMDDYAVDVALIVEAVGRVGVRLRREMVSR
ncbi:MAG: hypothetical protein ABSD78_10215 [Acidimicrobiales bacterium]|jgi:hypothetical protein